MTYLPGDLLARLAWMAEHDRRTLVRVLATVDRDALDAARKLADRDGGPDLSRSAGQLGRDTAQDGP